MNISVHILIYLPMCVCVHICIYAYIQAGVCTYAYIHTGIF